MLAEREGRLCSLSAPSSSSSSSSPPWRQCALTASCSSVGEDAATVCRRCAYEVDEDEAELSLTGSNPAIVCEREASCVSQGEARSHFATRDETDR